MINLDLNIINESHLVGKWTIHEVLTNKSHPYNFFENQRNLEFLSSGIFKCFNGKHVIGSWTVQKHSQIIYNPEKNFFLQDKIVGIAIVTRLYQLVEDKINIRKLTLYFSTGLEIVYINQV